MHVAIRADGGPEIGYGHLVRTSALAETLRERGQEVTLATTTPESAIDMYGDIDTVVKLTSRWCAEEFLAEMEHNNPDAIVTDAYPIDGDQQRALREEYPLLVIQDDARHRVCADVLANGNVYASELEYKFIGEDPRRCLGPEYLLIRQALVDVATREPLWRDEPERAIVTMGGSDLAQMTPTIVRAFDGYELTLDVVVGPGFSRRQERDIRVAVEETSVEANVSRDPDDLPERMLQADIGICTASTTAYELLALGTPIVAIPQVSNQIPIARALDRRNLAEVLPPRLDRDELGRVIDEYVSNAQKRRSRRDRGRELIDCRGPIRVADKLTSMAADR